MPVIGRRDIPIKRHDVAEWIQEARDQHIAIKDHIQAKVFEKGLADTEVDMGGDVGNVHMLDLIMMELDSYE
jgi:hypothetical protein